VLQASVVVNVVVVNVMSRRLGAEPSAPRSVAERATRSRDQTSAGRVCEGSVRLRAGWAV